MNYVIAVSGGVDSVVLLDMLAKKYHAGSAGRFRITSCVVAHFDHGIRSDSARDMAFVRDLAKAYGLPFVTKRERLGPDASEALARERRYAFLREVARKNKAKIVTAHHADDVVETVAINLTRGTGWRGLAVLDSTDIVRPLATMRKAAIVKYAHKHGLEWREDSTNRDTKYLRNDIRQRLKAIDDDMVSLMGLYRRRQRMIGRLIDEEASKLIGEGEHSRHLFIMIPDEVAIELLRTVLLNDARESPTIPARRRLLHAIKTFVPGSRFVVSSGVVVRFTKSTFVVEAATEVVS